MIGFIEPHQDPGARDGGCAWRRWQYVKSYRRRAKLAAWLNGLVGEPRDMRGAGAGRYCGGTGNMTGYELADHLRQWLEREGHASRSACEVILADGCFAEARPD